MHRTSRALALLSVGTITAALLIAPASAASVRCFGERANVVGTNGADVLVGTPKRDVIAALGGDDRIRGGGKRDVICAGSGDDVVRAGDGDDLIFGEGGDDRLYGQGGRFNQIVPGKGDDQAVAGPGAPGFGSELIYLDISGGVVMDAGTGTVTGSAGNDTFVGFLWLIGSTGDDVITGSDAEFEVLYGAEGDDTISALGGEDALAGGPGDDVVDGGEGDDSLVDLIMTFLYGPEPVAGPLTVNLLTGSLTGNGTDTLTSIESSTGSLGDDVMIGDDGPNEFTVLIDGDDTVDAGGGDDTVDGGDGVDDLDGGAGTDTLGNLDATAGVTIDLGAGTTSDGDAIANFEDVIGSFYDDTIAGNSLANTIEGADGADTITGLAGDDVLIGGWIDGFDDGAPDSADGGDGTDACAAETETNCETDPAPAVSVTSISRLALTSRTPLVRIG